MKRTSFLYRSPALRELAGSGKPLTLATAVGSHASRATLTLSRHGTRNITVGVYGFQQHHSLLRGSGGRIQGMARQRLQGNSAPWKITVLPSASSLMPALKSAMLSSLHDPAARLYSFPSTLDGRWAMIDTKPVWVPVPTLWQRIAYWLYKLASIVFGIATCAAITFFIYTLPNDAKWFLVLAYPIPIWIAYTIFGLGEYNTVERWAELRALCTSAPFSTAIAIPGAFDCMTPRELRKKLLREATGKECSVEWIATSGLNLPALQQAGLFSLKEIEEIAEFRRSFLNIRDQYALSKNKIDSAFGNKLQRAEEIRDKTIRKAEYDFENSAELRLSREIDSNFGERAREMNRVKEAKKDKIKVDPHLSDAEKTVAIQQAERKAREKIEHLRQVRDIKIQANSDAVLKKSKEKEVQIRDAREVFEQFRRRLYQQEGIQQKYDNLQKDYARNKKGLQEQWQEYVEASLIPNEESVPDAVERHF